MLCLKEICVAIPVRLNVPFTLHNCICAFDVVNQRSPLYAILAVSVQQMYRICTPSDRGSSGGDRAAVAGWAAIERRSVGRRSGGGRVARGRRSAGGPQIHRKVIFPRAKLTHRPPGRFVGSLSIVIVLFLSFCWGTTMGRQESNWAPQMLWGQSPLFLRPRE